MESNSEICGQWFGLNRNEHDEDEIVVNIEPRDPSLAQVLVCNTRWDIRQLGMARIKMEGETISGQLDGVLVFDGRSDTFVTFEQYEKLTGQKFTYPSVVKFEGTVAGDVMSGTYENLREKLER